MGDVVDSKREDGGPAFPVAPDDLVGSKGMSLRDWFAGQALPMLADIGHDEDWTPAHVAEMAYHYADAMLTARSKEA